MRKLLGLVVLLSNLFVLGFATDANAQQECGDEVIVSEHIEEGLLVVGDCLLFDVTVDGNVTVEPGASLLFLFTQIFGNVQSDGGVRVIGCGPPTAGCLFDGFDGNHITGSLQLENLTGSEESSGYVGEIDIEGDVQFKDNLSQMVALDGVVGGSIEAKRNTDTLFIGRNSVVGDVQVKENTTTALGVFSNMIDGNLQCKDNEPFFFAAGNVVEGKVKGQCAGP